VAEANERLCAVAHCVPTESIMANRD